jgi:hypothetical protein
MTKSSANTKVHPREQMVDYLRSVLFGPMGGVEEVIEGTPFLRYMTGMLFPQRTSADEIGDAVAATAEDDATGLDDDPESQRTSGAVGLSAESLPSSVAISFRVDDSAQINCEAAAAVYIPADDNRSRSSRRWSRRALSAVDGKCSAIIDKKNAHKPIALWGGKAEVVVQWRTRGDGTAVVTVALVNTSRAERRGPDPANTLFQVGLRCTIPDRRILRYPEVEASSEQGSEDAEVLFLYRKVAVYARGHGAAATWGDVSEGRCGWVAVDYIPDVEVPRASFEVSSRGLDSRYNDLEFLINGDKREVLRALKTLVDGYSDWVADRRRVADSPHEPKIHRELVSRAEHWVDRMRSGVDALRDERAFRAFRLANEAMSIQMALSRARPKIPHRYEERTPRPTIDSGGKRWRPFQIAFMLASIEPLLDPGSRHRDIVDVIWFPTGGGKTEAYLLVAAFEMIRRRLVHGDVDTATAVISRYTLRFLTAQQFQRTAALMVALEIMRIERHADLGQRSFSLGLWVGGDVTPNTFRIAHERLEQEIAARDRKNPFMLQACPCCGTAILPRTGPRAGIGVVATVNDFRFFCPNTTCTFKSGLPFSIVDEALYRSPPSMLLATIDKFAQLPWDDRARPFFAGTDDRSPPPSLILQDELHLISGPLGSLAAPYDAAIDAIIKARGGHAKRVCSTATIRNAHHQVMGLYGRLSAIFPSPCSAWDDAYFFRTDPDRPGRKYVGVMGQGYIKPVVAMTWTSAALLQSVKELPMPPAARDAYWTLVAYHNSRRELGRTLSAARDEIQARIKSIASSPALVRAVGEPLELSAQITRNLGEAIEALERPHTPANPAEDLVPCTSIISVGVDLDRLGLMLMNGQPKLTSEYIQATSRVGRGESPGLVISLFSSTKPRDRSHYEDFRSFHESIYRHVEPTSVTPYSIPARDRTLHAALVSAIRHATPYRANDAARNIDFDSVDVRKVLDVLQAIMCASDASEAGSIKTMIEKRLEEWKEKAESGVGLLYERRQAGMQFASLLHEYGAAPSGSLWATMNSVRNVDAEARLDVN